MEARSGGEELILLCGCFAGGGGVTSNSLPPAAKHLSKGGGVMLGGGEDGSSTVHAYIVPYSWKIWRVIKFGSLAVYITIAKLKFAKLSYLHIHMYMYNTYFGDPIPKRQI